MLQKMKKCPFSEAGKFDFDFESEMFETQLAVIGKDKILSLCLNHDFSIKLKYFKLTANYLDFITYKNKFHLIHFKQIRMM